MRITPLIALGLVIGCFCAYPNTNVVYVLKTDSGMIVATNGRVTRFPAIPAPIIPTPTNRAVYRQPNPISLRNTNLTLPSKPTPEYVRRFNSLRKDYHMDSTGKITKVVSTNMAAKH